MATIPHRPDSTPSGRWVELGLWSEYDAAANWCAQRGLAGNVGDRLPEALSADCYDLIADDVDAFRERVAATAYANAMQSRTE